jgi:hypothetical protein
VNHDEFSKFKGGYCQARTQEHYPFSFFTHVSRIGRLKGIFEPYFFSFHDFLFETCFCDTYSGQLEMNFKKPREVFL